MYNKNSKRMWRNWYTRTFEGRVALPCEFESRHPHIKLKALLNTVPLLFGSRSRLIF